MAYCNAEFARFSLDWISTPSKTTLAAWDVRQKTPDRSLCALGHDMPVCLVLERLVRTIKLGSIIKGQKPEEANLACARRGFHFWQQQVCAVGNLPTNNYNGQFILPTCITGMMPFRIL
jgi:hypothetical protein